MDKLTHTHILYTYSIAIMYVWKYKCTYDNTCTYIHTYIRTYIHTYIRTYMYIHTYIHSYIHTYIHTYTHTHSISNTFITNSFTLSPTHTGCVCASTRPGMTLPPLALIILSKDDPEYLVSSSSSYL